MIVRDHIKSLVSKNNSGIDTTLLLTVIKNIKRLIGKNNSGIDTTLLTITKIAVQAEGSILLEMIQYLIEGMSNENIHVRADAREQVTE
jgi:ABC-type branched-subunit amino acid transport system ATPase component